VYSTALVIKLMSTCELVETPHAADCRPYD